MSNCLWCEKENPPSKNNKPRKYCSKKCANDWHYKHGKRQYIKKNADWGTRGLKELEDRKRRKEIYEWHCKNMWSIPKISKKYNLERTTIWCRAKAHEMEGKLILWGGKHLFFTEEQAIILGTVEITPDMENEYLRRRRSMAKRNSKSYRQRPEVKERNNRRKRARRRSDPIVRLKHNVRNAIHYHIVIRQGREKGGSTFEHLPYTPVELKEHIESQFDSHMTWDNYGTYWQIDHIIPQAALIYDSLNHPNFQKCWALENLQPLESKANATKGSLYAGKRYTYKKNKPSNQ